MGIKNAAFLMLQDELNQTQIGNVSFYDGRNKNFLLSTLPAHELMSS